MREEIAKRLRYGYEYANVVMEISLMIQGDEKTKRQGERVARLAALSSLVLGLQQSLKLLAVKLLMFHKRIGEQGKLIVIRAQ